MTVTLGTETLSATSETGGAWSVPVPAAATYLTGTEVEVTVEASKTGYTDATPVMRTLVVDLVAPSSRTYTVPGSLQVGVPVTGVSPSTTTDTDIASYRAAGLPVGLAIAADTGVISGTPTTASAGTSSVTVTIADDAGNETTVSLTFPAVSKGEQDLSEFGYTPPTVTFDDAAPSLSAPSDPKGAVTYSAMPSSSSVCRVDASTGALAIVAAGTCEVTATAAATADYEAASEAFTVTVTEPDVAGIRLTETMLDVPRGGTATYGVKLTTRPAGNVTVRIAGIAGTGLTVTDAGGVDLGRGSAGLTFTTGDWEVDQHVTVAAEGDADAADYEVTINHRASGADYDGVTAPLTVMVAKRGVCHRDPSLRDEIVSHRDREDGRGDDARRCPRRRRRDADAVAVGAAGGDDWRRGGDGDHHEHRCDAAGVARAVRPHGGRPGARCGAGAHRGVARARVAGERCGAASGGGDARAARGVRGADAPGGAVAAGARGERGGAARGDARADGTRLRDRLVVHAERGERRGRVRDAVGARGGDAL